jgi:hypothetical protein
MLIIIFTINVWQYIVKSIFIYKYHYLLFYIITTINYN